MTARRPCQAVPAAEKRKTGAAAAEAAAEAKAAAEQEARAAGAGAAAVGAAEASDAVVAKLPAADTEVQTAQGPPALAAAHRFHEAANGYMAAYRELAAALIPVRDATVARREEMAAATAAGGGAGGGAAEDEDDKAAEAEFDEKKARPVPDWLPALMVKYAEMGMGAGTTEGKGCATAAAGGGGGGAAAAGIGRGWGGERVGVPV